MDKLLCEIRDLYGEGTGRLLHQIIQVGKLPGRMGAAFQFLPEAKRAVGSL